MDLGSTAMMKKLDIWNGNSFNPFVMNDGFTDGASIFSRLDLKSGEKSSWTPIPRQFPTASLAL